MTKRKFEIIGRVSTDSVYKGSGKHWDDWVPLLEKAGARNWSHKEIVAYLAKKHKLTPWWQQGVTLGFEIATGRRIEGQTQKGDYTVTATKSLAFDAKTVWKLLSSDEGVRIFLNSISEFSFKKGATFETADGYFGEVRTLKAGAKVRLSWQDEDAKGIVQIAVYPKVSKKSLLVLDHSQIKTARKKEEFRARWREALERLAELLNQSK